MEKKVSLTARFERLVIFMILSEHAKQRWDERFSNFNLENELSNAKIAGKAIRRKIKQKCKHSTHLGLNSRNKTVYLISKNNIVFVVRLTSNLIVTVMPYDK